MSHPQYMDHTQPTSANEVKNCIIPIASCVFDTADWLVDVAAKAAIMVPNPGSITLTKAQMYEIGRDTLGTSDT